LSTIIESIATANPPFRRSQVELATFMSKAACFSPAMQAKITTVYERSGIEHRYSCLFDYGADPDDFQFFPPNWGFSPAPTTRDRLEQYKTSALKIAVDAAEKAISQSSSATTAITHLIVVSCTGFSAPGLDIQLIQSLGLSANTDRTMIGFMGCQAALNGLKTADAICQSQPQAKVLLVCVELCSLHFQVENSLESVVVNAIFGDGAAAVILTAQSPETARGKLAYVGGHSLLTPDSTDMMSWNIGNTGFLMGLSPKVPKAIAEHLPSYITALRDRYDLSSDTDLDFWAIHPGGRQILDQVQSVLQLSDPMIADSYGVLRDYGNMSSPTILFILERIWQQHRSGSEFKHGAAIAFGPGLTIEGCLFEQVI
jgi:alpha-pyrone synthase